MCDLKTCPKCGIAQFLDAFKQTEDGNIRNHTCKKCIGRAYRYKLRLDTLNALGRTCACCGETNPNFLTLDHVKNDGSRHRESFTCQQAMADARRQGYPVHNYQLLCFNCNMAREAYGECPHKSNLTTDQIYAELEDSKLDFGKTKQRYNTDLTIAREARRLKNSSNPVKDMREMISLLTPEQLKELVASIGGN